MTLVRKNLGRPNEPGLHSKPGPEEHGQPLGMPLDVGLKETISPINKLNEVGYKIRTHNLVFFMKLALAIALLLISINMVSSRTLKPVAKAKSKTVVKNHRDSIPHEKAANYVVDCLTNRKGLGKNLIKFITKTLNSWEYVVMDNSDFYIDELFFVFKHDGLTYQFIITPASAVHNVGVCRVDSVWRVPTEDFPDKDQSGDRFEYPNIDPLNIFY